jgi:adenylosuccinate synthase
LFDELGEALREKGGEYGATTGRPRRCGWLDAVVLRDSVRLNGLSHLAVTKLDVLTGIKTLKICTAYSWNGQVFNHVPAQLQVLENCQPCYEEWEGWSEPLRGIRRKPDLPRQAQRYLERIESLAGVPLSVISVGPERDETLHLSNPFAM